MITLNQDLLEKLGFIWDKVKNFCICMEVGGSYAIPYINIKHDIDVILVHGHNINKKELLNLLHSEDVMILKQYIKDNYNAVIIPRRLVTEITSVNRTWMYIFKPFNYSQIIFGEQYEQIDFDFMANKESVKEMCRTFISKIEARKEIDGIPKGLYHTVTVMYYLKNNEWTLTQEQIENINIVHDQSDHAKIEELYEELKEWCGYEENKSE